MRFVFLDNDTKLLFATAYDGDWDPYIDDFATKIPNELDLLFFCNCEGWPGIHSPSVKDWIAKHQVPADGWYVANPNLTVAQAGGSNAPARRWTSSWTRSAAARCRRDGVRVGLARPTHRPDDRLRPRALGLSLHDLALRPTTSTGPRPDPEDEMTATEGRPLAAGRDRPRPNAATG